MSTRCFNLEKILPFESGSLSILVGSTGSQKASMSPQNGLGLSSCIKMLHIAGGERTLLSSTCCCLVAGELPSAPPLSPGFVLIRAKKYPASFQVYLSGGAPFWKAVSLRAQGRVLKLSLVLSFPVPSMLLQPEVCTLILFQ